jgi:hypothetical protein
MSPQNAPVLGVVFPIGPGAAKRAVKPAPETAPEALSVERSAVKVTLPIGGGLPNDPPPLLSP